MKQRTVLMWSQHHAHWGSVAIITTQGSVPTTVGDPDLCLTGYNTGSNTRRAASPSPSPHHTASSSASVLVQCR